MVYLIYGPPCSGKSTYTMEHMKRGDLLCDVDMLYSAISGENPHDAELNVHEIACKLYGELANIIHDRVGGWKNAYVLSCANTHEKVKEESEKIRADEVLFMDTPYEVCIKRTAERPHYFQWLVQEWFETSDLIGEPNG